MKSMKIGICIWMFVKDTGGLYRHTEDLIRELQRLGHDVVVVTRFSSFLPSGVEYAFRNEIEPVTKRDGVEIRHIQLRGKFAISEWLLTKCHHRKCLNRIALFVFDVLSRRSARVCLEDRDLVHHIGQSNALVGFAAQRAANRLRLPFVVQPTVHPGQCGDSALDLGLFMAADQLFVHTEFEKEFFERSIPSCRPTLRVVGNGISDRSDGSSARFRQTRGIHGLFVLYVGRKERDKGFPLAFAAWQLARKDCPDLTFVCMGPPGSPADGVGHASPGFIDLGFCDEQEKHDALAACSCLCVPSEGESFGLIFMEAGRYRKPVIARRLPVLIELIGEDAAVLVGTASGYNHVVVDETEISDAICSIIQNPANYNERGELLYQKSSRFLWQNVVRSFEHGYLEILEKIIDEN